MAQKNVSLTTVVIIIVAIILVLGIFGLGFRDKGILKGYDMGLSSFSGIFGILIFVLIIAGIYWLIKNSNKNSNYHVRRKK